MEPSKKLRVRTATYCCVPQCTTYRKKGVSLFRLPKHLKNNPKLLKKWRLALKIGKEFPKNFAICIKHFEPKDILTPITTNKKVRSIITQSAIPCRNLPINSANAKNCNQLMKNNEKINEKSNIARNSLPSLKIPEVVAEGITSIKIEPMEQNATIISTKIPEVEEFTGVNIEKTTDKNRTVIPIQSKNGHNRNDVSSMKQKEKLKPTITQNPSSAITIPVNAIKAFKAGHLITTTQEVALLISNNAGDYITTQLGQNVLPSYNLSVHLTDINGTKRNSPKKNTATKKISKTDVHQKKNLTNNKEKTCLVKITNRNIPKPQFCFNEKHCWVPNCETGKLKSIDTQLLYPFPEDEFLRKTWINTTQIKTIMADIAYVCYLHFDSADFKDSEQRKLKPTAVPTKNVDESDKKTTIIKKKTAVPTKNVDESGKKPIVIKKKRISSKRPIETSTMDVEESDKEDDAHDNNSVKNDNKGFKGFEGSMKKNITPTAVSATNIDESNSKQTTENNTQIETPMDIEETFDEDDAPDDIYPNIPENSVETDSNTLAPNINEESLSTMSLNSPEKIEISDDEDVHADDNEYTPLNPVENKLPFTIVSQSEVLTHTKISYLEDGSAVLVNPIIPIEENVNSLNRQIIVGNIIETISYDNDYSFSPKNQVEKVNDKIDPKIYVENVSTQIRNGTPVAIEINDDEDYVLEPQNQFENVGIVENISTQIRSENSVAIEINDNEDYPCIANNQVENFKIVENASTQIRCETPIAIEINDDDDDEYSTRPKACVQNATTQTKIIKHPIINLIRSDSEFSHMTGISNFGIIFKIEKYILQYMNMGRNLNINFINILTIRNMIFLVLIKLKQHCSFTILGMYFNITSEIAYEIFNGFISVMADALNELVELSPTKKTNKKLPKQFLKFRNTKLIIACMDISISLKRRSPRNTMTTYLIGCNPFGEINYVSVGYEKFTDNQIFEKEELLLKLNKGDAVMVNKISRINHDLFIGTGINLYKANKDIVVVQNTEIELAWVMVESCITKMKIFNILTDVKDMNFIKNMDEIIFTIACIINLSRQ